MKNLGIFLLMIQSVIGIGQSDLFLNDTIRKLCSLELQNDVHNYTSIFSNEPDSTKIFYLYNVLKLDKGSYIAFCHFEMSRQGAKYLVELDSSRVTRLVYGEEGLGCIDLAGLNYLGEHLSKIRKYKKEEKRINLLVNIFIGSGEELFLIKKERFSSVKQFNERGDLPESNKSPVSFRYTYFISESSWHRPFTLRMQFTGKSYFISYSFDDASWLPFRCNIGKPKPFQSDKHINWRN